MGLGLRRRNGGGWRRCWFGKRLKLMLNPLQVLAVNESRGELVLILVALQFGAGGDGGAQLFLYGLGCVGVE